MPISEPTYQQRIDALRQTKMEHTALKRTLEGCRDSDDKGNIPWPEQGTEEGVAVADDGTVYGGYTNIPGAHRFLKN